MNIRKSTIGLAALAAATVLILGSARSSACEGEIEWASTPLIGVIEIDYKECVETTIVFPTPLIRQTFRVRVRDGRPGEVYDVAIEGRPVLSLRTDGDGDAEAIVVRHGLRIGPDGRPITRKRIDGGDLCQIHVDGTIYEDVFVQL